MNLLHIVSEILKNQLVNKIAEDGKSLEIISKATGVSEIKLIEILRGRSNNVTLSELSSLFRYCSFEITQIITVYGESSERSFQFIIDPDLFSLN